MSTIKLSSQVKPTLLILAGGMGNRYGGLKQIDRVGPNGEILLDYAVYDALGAGFGKIVFVIRHYFEDAFRKTIGSKYNGVAETVYAYQELDSYVADFEVPPGRSKPWGTGHAVIVAKDVIDEPFAVINADDFYGAESFRAIATYLGRPGPDNEYYMVGYTLRNTLSEYGQVCRGVCQCDENCLLRSIVERKGVKRSGNQVYYLDETGQERTLTGDEVVSMNLWGFKPLIFRHLQGLFNNLLNEYGTSLDWEFFIPSATNDLIVRDEIRVRVLSTGDEWFGLTYQPDKAIVSAAIRKLIEQGRYPERLWK